jgi:adenine-specific DNA methylase
LPLQPSEDQEKQKIRSKLIVTTNRRLIEVAFPLKQTSIDSVHEKNVRHGHISTLHIWPARRPLAACRAALIATLLPDPENDEERQLILDKLGGKLVQRVKKVKNADGKVEEKLVEETEGGILHWGRESGPDLEWFRQKIREAYGGRAPKVLDPFAGGGAIPLEAMRLGCEATAVDINPVAWFILKCTLEYPQNLAGQMRPLPDFALQDREFMESFFKAQGLSKQAVQTRLTELGHTNAVRETQLSYLTPSTATHETIDGIQADLAWHVRAWGRWVLARARRDLSRFYPMYADFEPLVDVAYKVEKRPMQLIPLNEDGTLDLDALNTEFDEVYLREKRNPRWVAKPTVAYLWARTVTCKNCRAVIPLLKTRWLCKKDNKRVVLTMQPNEEKTGVVFGVQPDVPVQGNTSAQRREYDKKVGGGTMSRSGATCPCCGAIMTQEDIKLEGQAERLGVVLTSVVVNGSTGKQYRLPVADEIRLELISKDQLGAVFAEVPLGLPAETIIEDAKRNTWCVQYGIDRFYKLFTSRQLLTLGTFVNKTQSAHSAVKEYYDSYVWVEAIIGYLALAVDRVANRSSTMCIWNVGAQEIEQTFIRFVLPVLWDFAESNPLADASGNYAGEIEWVSLVCTHINRASSGTTDSHVISQSAQSIALDGLDIVVTDPPYYDAIGYSILMDFFYVWLRRATHGLSRDVDSAFANPLAPKWDHDKNDGELIDDASRFGGSREKSKLAYEEGMFHVFQNCCRALLPDGRLVVVFAHKHPDAWETLLSAIIRAGFVVDGSWPIQTERTGRMRAKASAALSSSIWLVCKKRSDTARPGWDNRVLDEMRQKIADRLRDFWDAGIRGPDFVWAATGPALEAYSQYPAVKKANEPGQLMTVSEFLGHVRRMVVDFVIGRVLAKDGEPSTVSGLDDVTTYYLLHRNDFGFDDAPAGACILYAVSCGLSDKDLADRYDLLARTGGKEAIEEDESEEGDAGEIEEGSGSTLRLKSWQQRKRPSMGGDPALDSTTAHLPMFPDMEAQVSRSREVPLIDQIHRLMHLWKAGDVNKVNDYLDLRGLRRNQLFHQLLQALIELAPVGSEERSLMESISNHVVGRGQTATRLFQD